MIGFGNFSLTCSLPAAWLFVPRAVAWDRERGAGAVLDWPTRRGSRLHVGGADPGHLRLGTALVRIVAKGEPAHGLSTAIRRDAFWR